MVGTVLSAARKTFVVRLFVGLIEVLVCGAVLAVVGGMCVFVVVGEGR